MYYLIILVYFYLSKVFNAGLLLVIEYTYIQYGVSTLIYTSKGSEYTVYLNTSECEPLYMQHGLL